MYYDYAQPQESASNTLLQRVFSWMATALSLTGVTAFFVYYNDATRQLILSKPSLLIGLLFVQLLVVIIFSVAVYRVSFAVGLMLFLTYAVLTGVTLSTIFMVYTMSSIASTFLITSIMFGGMSLYGYLTNDDLSSMGSFLRMALWGVIVAMLVNLFLRSPLFNTIISIIAVIIFTGLTAYDVQKIKQISAMMIRDRENYSKIALVGALTLYLDFINLFLNLLQLTGRRRD